ncbi:MAG: putative ribonucleoside-diphosphate reductase subunit beta [Prokaryotic dsDNA virus sp.]|nr:MAG: putative ribonucleoside-diphosphate reductase subunit beta [Prokaryotic dsDNA virus sp.]|tara:strand:- start:1283 stop:2281 length:999 start_codon:yes stop_codon:yes gene_type:complete
MAKKPRILTKKDTYTFDYPEVFQFEEAQQKILWTASEVEVSKDVQDLLVNMTEAESHGVKEVLKLFTLYEIIVGGEYWGGKFQKICPRPELIRVASLFSYVELGVHAVFYSKLDEALMLNTDEHYASYQHDPALKARIDFIEKAVTDKNPLVSLGVFSMTEGAILYSNFAFLRHFQVNGKDLLKNVNAGITASVKDENLHSEYGAYVYRLMKDEILRSGWMTVEEVRETEDYIIECARKIYEHEQEIIKKIFSKGEISGITEKQMDNFVQHRIDLCLGNLGLPAIYKPKYNPIADWFYDDINAYKFHDFFNSGNFEYVRNYNENKFVWRTSE